MTWTACSGRRGVVEELDIFCPKIVGTFVKLCRKPTVVLTALEKLPASTDASDSETFLFIQSSIETHLSLSSDNAR